ncbi:MAG: alpha-amylase, partial [Bifidobacterium sp.]|nr:alpha-amylase [Bifidobacterium sp.]
FPETPGELPVQAQNIYRAHQDLIGLRRRNSWLTTATTTKLQLENRRYRYRSAAADASAYLDVDIDLTAAPSATITDASGQIAWKQRKL